MESEKGELVLVQQAMSVVYIVSINWLHCPFLSDSKVLLTVEQFWLLLDPNSKTTIWKHPSESEHLAVLFKYEHLPIDQYEHFSVWPKGFWKQILV